MVNTIKRMVIYHGPHCPDGFTGAWVIHKALKRQRKELGTVYYPTTYGEDAPDVSGYDEVILVDFSYPPAILYDMCRKAKNVLLLDHHESFKESLDNTNAEMPSNFRSFIFFGISGAIIAWQYFNNTLGNFNNNPGMPLLIKYVSDRDLHTWELPNSRELSAYIMSVEKTFDRWDDLATEFENDFGGAFTKGEIIMATRENIVSEIVSNTATAAWLDETPIWVCNSSTLYSDAADRLINTVAAVDKVAACYHFAADHVKFSVRSKWGCLITAKEISERYGGGGHVHAAGFRLSFEDFFRIVKFPPTKP